MNFLTKMKNKKEDKTLQNLDVRLKKGKITFEEAMLAEAKLYARAAWMFSDMTRRARLDVEKYNSGIERAEELVNDILSGNQSEHDDHLSRLCLMHCYYKVPQEVLDYINTRNNSALNSMVFAVQGIQILSEIAGVEYDERKMKKMLDQLCARPDVKAYCVARRLTFGDDPRWNTPYPGECSTFSILFSISNCLLRNGFFNGGKCFNEHGFLYNEMGECLLEEDLYKKLQPIDYKGIFDEENSQLPTT